MGNKVFLDTNILLDILSGDRISSQNSKELFLKYSNEEAKFIINDLSLNTLYYIGSKINRDKTISFMKEISFNNPLFDIYYMKKEDLKEIFYYIDKNNNNIDFEDLQQYISAKNSGCSCIITNDKNFPKLDLPLIRTNSSIKNYYPKGKN